MRWCARGGYQLLEWPAARLVALHPSLITPPQAALTQEARLAIAAYVAAGGQLVEASDDPGWGLAAARVALEASLLAAVDAASAEPPRARLLGAEDSAAHLVAYTSGQEGLLLFVLNNFTGCFGGSTAPAPAPLPGLSIEFRLPPTAFPERAIRDHRHEAATRSTERGRRTGSERVARAASADRDGSGGYNRHSH